MLPLLPINRADIQMRLKKVLPIKGGFFLQISHLYMVKVQDNEHA